MNTSTCINYPKFHSPLILILFSVCCICALFVFDIVFVRMSGECNAKISKERMKGEKEIATVRKMTMLMWKTWGEQRIQMNLKIRIPTHFVPI